MAENLLQAPRLSGLMFDSNEYTNMGVGLTDRVMIIGHGDGYSLNDPIQVVDIRKTVQDLGADDSSPVLRGLLEAYYAGARDLWVVLAAPMEEYVERTNDRTEGLFDGLNFYERYAQRLEETYALLVDYEVPQIIVTLDAPLYGAGDVDFLTPLADFCSESFDITGSVKIGLIGTEIGVDDTGAVEALVSDERLEELGRKGKFIVPIVGSGVFNLQEIPTVYVASPIASVGGLIAGQYWDRGITYARVPNVITIGSKDFTKSEVEQLCNAKLNPLIRTTRSKRGRAGEVVLASDNTLGEDGSDFWSMNQVRLIMHCNEQIRALGHRYLGSIGFAQFKQDVEKFMVGLMADDIIRGFTLNVEKIGPLPDNNYTSSANVDVSITPFFGIRDISFTTRVGPGA